MKLSLANLANIAQIISVPLTILAWLITRERFAEFWKKWGTPILVITVVLAAAVLCRIIVIPVLKWLQEQKQRAAKARLYYNHQQKIEILTELINDFEAFEKATSLADVLTSNVRVVSILPVEGGKLGVMIDIGKEENLQEGTQFLIYQIDNYTSNGQPIEHLLGLVRVTYVQVTSNCSQAVVLARSDREYWDHAMICLRQKNHIDPPKNIAIPYIPHELRSLSSEDRTAIRQYLKTIYASFTHTKSDQVLQE